jgi:hypothetical protein
MAGTIIGAMNKVEIRLLLWILERTSANAASVPIVVAIKEDKTATVILIGKRSCHFASLITAWYHFKLKPTGGNPRVSEDVKLIATEINIGAKRVITTINENTVGRQLDRRRFIIYLPLIG